MVKAIGEFMVTIEAVKEMRKMMKKFKPSSYWGLAYDGKAIVPITRKMAKELTLLGLEEYLVCPK